VFNVADAAIVCGVAALVCDGMLTHPKPGEPQPPGQDRLAGAPDRG
jgi:lipoprotein signal peptidase